ncbi:hypothetical protein EPUS_03094 [Endocarpon pusillum Z07020]|uniref:Frequency clock protein n=1 Tax=Endocarpon pusillum (strain Z07020 / HMAS-L-300199) TaxID=1263415 RepID=U1G783_ENDPU|nr:uncharacterized protein EPUS_03094 [Endocarpon pusillum Z07020]ERF73262.1 hypothetical protein EPUS_03094 [Endocarpon pusillum Z07020]
MSESRQTSASKWFDTVNQNVKPSIQSNSDVEREPPFYLNRHDSGHTSAQMNTAPLFGNVQTQLAKEDSENEDLRSVIDDLTIENKRLRQMLRERRQQYDPQLDHDKLFEVRTCGLALEKKRELQAILQRFAATITDVSFASSKMPRDESAYEKASSDVPGCSAKKAASYPHTDSAYASMSNSGLTSVGQADKTQAEMQQIRGSKDKTVKSYLQDIPDSLLPKHPPIMSEKSKMRLVVKMLEQLFTGKHATPGEHSQPLQQQMISESAANADRHCSELLKRYVRPEGAREAHILPIGAKMLPKQPKSSSSCPPPLGSRSESEKSSDERSASDNRSPDQRPTRPLDLDIQRAQVAKENIDYIRHLGLPTPTRQHDSDHDYDGWVYLNLLINMAQLHTVNVTPAFVRKSIALLSTKFELSKDGRKVRWRGACSGIESFEDSDSSAEVTTGSSPRLVKCSITDMAASENSNNLPSTGSSGDQANGAKSSLPRGKHHFPNFTARGTQLPDLTDESRQEASFDYKPVYLKDRCMTQEDNRLSDDSNVTPSAKGLDESTGRYLSAGRHRVSQKYSGRTDEGGPIIYYRNPSFYCDLSGDREAYQRKATSNFPASGQILGVSGTNSHLEKDYQRRSMAHAEDAFEGRLDDDSLPSLDLAPLSEVVHMQSDLLELSACGIGGVVPDDHFVFQVQRRRQSKPSHTTAHLPANLCRGGLEPTIEEELLPATRIDLPASKLPPPSYVIISLSSGSSGGIESDELLSSEQDASEIEVFEEAPSARPSFLKRLSTDTSGQQCFSDEYDGELESCNSSRVHDSPEDKDSYMHVDGGSEAERGATLCRPPSVLSRSLMATVGAGSGASLASNLSTVSSMGSSLGAGRRQE